jgi:hypothetical protein
MIKELHFFNYDLTKKVMDSGIAPEGWYSKVRVQVVIEGETSIQEKWYYKEVNNDNYMVRPGDLYKDAFALDGTPIISEDGLYIIIDESIDQNTIIEENSDDFTTFEY